MGLARPYARLGLRLAIFDRGTRKALSLVAAVSALVCLVVTGTLGAQAVVQQDAEIQAWRQVFGDRSETSSRDSGVWLTSSSTYPTGSGAELTVLTIASERPGARLEWPGLSAAPKPGSVMVSERLSSVTGDVRSAIEQFVPPSSFRGGGQRVLDDQFLRGSEELVAIKFASAGDMAIPQEWKPLQAGTVRERSQTPNVAVVALALIFFAFATLLVTVSARFLQHNQPNIAAVRLQGAGRVGVALISLIPIALAAAVGALGGATLYASTTAFASELLPARKGFFLDRAEVAMPSALAAALGVTSVVVAMGLISLAASGRALAEVRGDDRPRRLPILQASLLLPAGVLLALGTVSSRRALFWWLGVVLFLIGILALGRLIIAALGRRSWTHLPRLLGFRNPSRFIPRDEIALHANSCGPVCVRVGRAAQLGAGVRGRVVARGTC